jgi:hypothetical protein
VKYLPLFHHFKAIYQFPKHNFLVQIVANASLKHYLLYNFQDKNTRKTFKYILDVTLFHRKRQDHPGGQIR